MSLRGRLLVRKVNMAWKRLKVAYMRKGWSLRKLKRALNAKKVRVRTIDVGRPKRHYIHVFYTKGGRLVATTYGIFKRKRR
jgi:hypothetical protein